MRRVGWLWSLLSILGLLLLSFAWFVGAFTDTMMAFPRPFSSTVWKAASPIDTDVRCRMTFDLRHRVGLEGRTPADIIRLLGDERRERPGLPDSYVLCPDLIDYMILELRWVDGRVASSRIHQS